MLTTEERAEWIARSAIERGQEGLNDPLYRLRWLYSILTARDEDEEMTSAKVLPFQPTEEQIEVIVAIHIRGWRRILIPKARQLGMSTVLALICLDFVVAKSGYTAALIDKRQMDADKKMFRKVRLGFKHLPEELRGELKSESDAVERLVVVDAENLDEAPSIMEGGTAYRGDTVDFLWISEWGWIQANDPRRSKEILAGSLPAAEKGIVVVETTWEGGKAGDVWPLVEEALNTPAEQAGPDTWRLMFFPWHSCGEYATTNGYEDPASTEYLDGKERELGLKFSKEQRKWYAGVSRKLKRLVRQEYPTTLDECWHAPVAGAIYGEEIDRLRSLSRTGKTFEFMRDMPIFTSWDLGMSDYTAMWLIQPHGTELLWLDWHEAEGQPASYYAGIVQKWENQYRPITRHFLPHDAGRREVGSGLSYLDTLNKLNISNVTVVPQTSDVWWGIGQLRELLARSTFHANCSVRRKTLEGSERMSGLECLEAYRKQTEAGPSGILREAPVHDGASHSSDAARTFAEGMARGLVPKSEKATRALARSFAGVRHRHKAVMNIGG